MLVTWRRRKLTYLNADETVVLIICRYNFALKFQATVEKAEKI